MIFRRATLRLTITYTVVQLALFAIFALAIYLFVTGSFDVEALPKGGDAADPEVILLRNGLIIFYGCLLIIIPVSSWLMARAALHPIKESFERQRAFIDGASHEMRTPLSVIQGELELALSRARTGAQYRESIGSALEATLGLSRLSDELLRLSGASREDLASTFERVGIDTVVDSAIAQTVGAASAAGVSVMPVRDGALAINGASALLVRAVSNVLENAIKFSPTGGTVTVTTSNEATQVLVRVSDAGVGMSTEETKRALERFWRADAARSTPGHGLGLALVDQILTAHGGTVSINSTLGSGTTVTMGFPEPRS